MFTNTEQWIDKNTVTSEKRLLSDFLQQLRTVLTPARHLYVMIIGVAGPDNYPFNLTMPSAEYN